jgi:hypothetical protein
MERRRPGSGRRAAARSSDASSAPVNAARAAAGGFGTPSGGIMPGAQLADDLLPHVGVAVDGRDVEAGERQRPAFTRSLWQVTQYCLRNAASGAGAGACAVIAGAERHHERAAVARSDFISS